MTRLDGLGVPYRIVPLKCYGCGKKHKFVARVHVPSNDFDRAYCPTCVEEQSITDIMMDEEETGTEEEKEE